MSFNYRRIRYENSKKIYITEVYYDENKRIKGWIDPQNISKDRMDCNYEQINLALNKKILIISEDGETYLRKE